MAYSKMTMPEWWCSNMKKFMELDGSFSHMDWQPQGPEINHDENLRDCREKIFWCEIFKAWSQEKVNATLTNMNIVTLHRFIEIIPWWMLSIITTCFQLWYLTGFRQTEMCKTMCKGSFFLIVFPLKPRVQYLDSRRLGLYAVSCINVFSTTCFLFK